MREAIFLPILPTHDVAGIIEFCLSRWGALRRPQSMFRLTKLHFNHGCHERIDNRRWWPFGMSGKLGCFDWENHEHCLLEF